MEQNVEAIPILNAIIDICVRKGKHDEMVDGETIRQIIDFCEDNVTTIVGTLDDEVLKKVVEASVEHSALIEDDLKYKATVLSCVIYAAENRLPVANELVDIFLVNFKKLNMVEKTRLNQLFSHATKWTVL